MSISNTDPEKPDEVAPVVKKPRFDQLRADHELFLRAFESEFKFEASFLEESLREIVVKTACFIIHSCFSQSQLRFIDF